MVKRRPALPVFSALGSMSAGTGEVPRQAVGLSVNVYGVEAGFQAVCLAASEVNVFTLGRR